MSSATQLYIFPGAWLGGDQHRSQTANASRNRVKEANK